MTRSGETISRDRLRHSLERFVLDEIRVRDILDHFRPHPEASQTVKTFAEDWLLQDQHDYVVVDHDQLAGIVSGSMLRYLPRSEWSHTQLRRVLRRNTPLAYSDELLEDAFQRMTENALTVLPVTDSKTGKFMGSISSHEILELLVSSARGE